MTINVVDVLVVYALGSMGAKVISDRVRLSGVRKTWLNMPRNIERGTCPECGSNRPECAKRVSSFWCRFKCCECGFESTAHVSAAKHDE